MKKILFLTRLYYPHIGGVETHIQKIAQELVKRNDEVTIITSSFDQSLSIQETVENVKIIRIPFDSEASKMRTWKWMNDHKVLFHESDVIHIHDVFWWVFPLLPFIRPKLFITFHGWEGQFPIKRTSILQRKIAASLVKGNIHVGEYIQKWYGTHANVVTYGAVDSSSQKNAHQSGKEVLKKVFNAAKSGSFVLKNKLKYEAIFLGRLSTDNDVDAVVRLFRLWKKEVPSAQFLFVGDGDLRDDCAEIGEVTGFVKNPDQYIDEAKIVCASSYLSIMSAQLRKKLVLSFYSNPLKKDYLSFYPQAKHMIIESEPQVALAKLSDLQKDKRRYNAYIESNHHWVKSQTWSKVTDEYEKLWNSNL